MARSYLHAIKSGLGRSAEFSTRGQTKVPGGGYIRQNLPHGGGVEASKRWPPPRLSVPAGRSRSGSRVFGIGRATGRAANGPATAQSPRNTGQTVSPPALPGILFPARKGSCGCGRSRPYLAENVQKMDAGAEDAPQTHGGMGVHSASGDPSWRPREHRHRPWWYRTCCQRKEYLSRARAGCLHPSRRPRVTAARGAWTFRHGLERTGQVRHGL